MTNLPDNPSGKQIVTYIKKALKDREVFNAFNPSLVAYHTHNGTDSPLIDFPINSTIAGGAGQSATVVIGPASNTDSAFYDFTTTGTNDDIQIQKAIDKLSVKGGLVLFREGTYTLGSASVVIAKNGVQLQGVGKGTIITCKNSFNKSFFILGDATTQYYNFLVRDMYIDGNKANVNMADKPIWDNMTKTKFIINAQFLNCYYINIDGEVLYSQLTGPLLGNLTGGKARFENNYIEDWDGSISGTYAPYCLGGGINAVNNTFNVSGTARGVILGDATNLFNGNTIYLPSNYNSDLINACGIVQDNSITTPSGSCNSSTVIVQLSLTVSNNYINMGTAPNVAAVAIRAYAIVQGNNLVSCGKGITFPAAGICTVTGNSIFNSQGHSIHIDTIANSSLAHVVSNNLIFQPGLATTNTYSGIIADVNSIIIGNTVLGHASVKMKYGINENSSGITSVINGNFVFSAQTQDIFVQSPTTDLGHNITT